MNFLAMYDSPLEVLYLVLTIGIALLVVFLSIILLHVIGILSNLKKVSAKTKDTVDLINHYLWQPIKIMLSILEKTKDVAKKTVQKDS